MVDTIALKTLAGFFPKEKPLYAVGGYVRDGILGLECHDVDVCSALAVDEVKTALQGSPFTVLDKNLRVGTVIIKGYGTSFEYTAFRQDSYPTGSGVHSPCAVEFTDDIRLDALRRDFGCNALYLDLLQDKIVDPLGAIDDVKKHVVKTVDTPSRVFGEDGQRILRMIRFASELGFEIEAQTLQTAKEYVGRIRDISVERIFAELDKILVADTAHPELGLTRAHVRGLELFDEVGLLDLILPEVTALKGLPQNPKYHLFDGYQHTVESFSVAPPHLRWVMLLHDVGKRPCLDDEGNVYRHADVGAKIAQNRLEYLRMPKNRIRRICRLIELHMIDVSGNTSPQKLKWKLARNFEYADDIALIKDADAYGAQHVMNAGDRLRGIIELIRKKKLPTSIKELKVDGNDLLQMGVDPKEIGNLLEQLWRDTVLDAHLNNRDKSIAYVKRRIEKND